MKKLNNVLILLFTLVTMALSCDALAKGGSFGGRSSSSFSSSRSSFSSSSRSSFSKPSSSKPSSSKPSSSKSATVTATPKTIKVSRDNVMSSIGKKGATGDAAGVLYKDFQSRNNRTINPSAKLNKADIDKMFTPNYRQSRRATYYGSYRPTPSTYYTQHVSSSGSYGIWDLMLFNSIMDNVGDRQMYYHHQSDPAFQSWRNDANAACVAGDKDVCEKLAGLDKEMAEYKAKGIKPDTSYITPGIDPDIYEANGIDPKNLAEIKICTGSIGSDYNRFATLISKVTKLKVKSVESNGSADNLAKLASGVCDLGFVQNDLLTSSSLNKIVTLNQLEVGLLTCPTDSKITSVKDLTNEVTVYIGKDQTGSQFTFDQLKTLSSNINLVKVNTSKSVMEIVGQIQNEPKSCMFAVSTPDFVGFQELDKTKKFKNVPIFSFDLDKKQPYKLVTVDVSHFNTLTQDQYKTYGWFIPGGTDTIAVQTSLVAPQNWIDQNKQLYDLLLLERSNLATSLQ